MRFKILSPEIVGVRKTWRIKRARGKPKHVRYLGSEYVLLVLVQQGDPYRPLLHGHLRGPVVSIRLVMFFMDLSELRVKRRLEPIRSFQCCLKQGHYVVRVLCHGVRPPE
jgi:hypothetical protein